MKWTMRAGLTACFGFFCIAQAAAAQAASVTNGVPAKTFDKGVQTVDVTPPLQWRWAERFFGHFGVDSISTGEDGCGAEHVYVGHNVGGADMSYVSEYLMSLGEAPGKSFNRLVVRGYATRLVIAEVYIDNVRARQIVIEPTEYVTPWQTTRPQDQKRLCNGDTVIELPGIAYGLHSVALKVTQLLPGDFRFDGLLVCPPAQARVHVGVNDDIQPLVDCNLPATEFVIAAGVHRNQEIVPKRGDKFVGEPGAILNGAVLLKGWERVDAHVWKKDVTVRPNLYPTHGTDACREGSLCNRPEDLYVDDQLYRHVAVSHDQLKEGQWLLEYPPGYDADGGHNKEVTATAYVYVADSQPADTEIMHTVEMSTYRFAFGRPHQDRDSGTPVDETDAYRNPESPVLAESDLTIEGLIIEKYANLYQHGAIGNQYPGDGWNIVNNIVRNNHSVGVRFGGHATVSGNHIYHNGQLGLGGAGILLNDFARPLHVEDGSIATQCDYFASDSVVSKNEIDHNRLPDVGFKVWAEGGGTKFTCTRNLLVTGNYVRANSGHGLWTDINNECVVYDKNRVSNNSDIGIFHEVSRSATISNNIARNNGIDPEGPRIDDPNTGTPDPNQGFDNWTANIQVTSSEGVSTADCPRGGSDAINVRNNVVEVNASNGAGIVLVRDDNRPQYWLKNVTVADNLVINKGAENEFSFVNKNNHPTTATNKIKSLTGAYAGNVSHQAEFWLTYKFMSNSYVVPSAYLPSSTLWTWNGGDLQSWDVFRSVPQEAGGRREYSNAVQTAISLTYAETSLQVPFGMLDSLYGLQNLERVDDGADQVWERSSGVATARIVGGIAEAPRKFGMVDSDGRFGVLLEHDAANTRSIPEASLSVAFRWGIGRSDDPALPSEQTSAVGDNRDDRDHMVTWLITDGPNKGNYVLAWEDSGDFDFNDLLVEVSGVAPRDQVALSVVSKDIPPDAFNPTPVVGGDAGTFTFKATFKNVGKVAINLPFFVVTELTNGNTLLNSDRGVPTGVGAVLTPDVGSETQIAPNDTVTVPFRIGLQNASRFRFVVELVEGLARR